MKKPTYKIASKGSTAYFSLVFIKRKTTISFLGQHQPVEKGNIYLFKEGINLSSQSEDAMAIFSYPKSFFDNLFISQIGECRIIFDFLNSNSKNEYLFFASPQKSLIGYAMDNLEHLFSFEKTYQDKLQRLSLVEALTLLDCYRDEYLQLNRSTMISDHRFGKLLKYMGDYYATITLHELAEKFGYHPDYLSYLFHKITHTTFSKKLLEIRLSQSLQMLEHSDCSIEDISLLIGFKDKSYFNRKFKEYYRCTPLAYRKKTQQK